jgi:hypothetical protein
MISKTKAYTDSTGAVHGTLEAAQRAELFTIFPPIEEALGKWEPAGIVNAIFENADKIRDVLSTRPSSRPGARKVNKGKSADAKTVKKGLDAARKAADAAAAS